MKKITLKVKHLFAALVMLSCIPANAQFTATLEQYAQSGYDMVWHEFKLSEVATALKTDTATLAAALNTWSSWSEESGTEQPADMFFLKVGETLDNNYTAGGYGNFWINRDGTVGSWGAGAVYYNNIWWNTADGADAFEIGFGQFPDSLAAGATLKPTFVLQYGENQVTFDMTYQVNPIPETPAAELEIAKLEIVGNAEVTVEQYPRTNYNSSAAYVNIAGAAEALGVDEVILPAILTSSLYRAYVDETYNIKSDSLTLATNNGGWGRIVLDELTGDSLTEVCAAPWSADDQFYMDSWAYDADTDTLSCNIGQYPNNLKTGDTYHTTVYIVYGSKAYAIKYNLYIIEDPNAFQGNLESMTVVGTQDIRVSQLPTTDYSAVEFTLNIDSIAGLFGCTAGDLTLMAIDNNGELSTQSTANAGGYWMTQGGIICAWGENAYFFVEPAASGDYSTFRVGQFPEAASVGEEGTTKLYLIYGNSYYLLNVTLAIEQGEVINQDAFESVATRSYIVQALDETYVWSTQSANIPFAQIYELIGTTEPVLYALNIDSIATQTGEKYTKQYTMGEKPGFWVTEDGRKNNWGSTSPWGITGLNSTSENFVIQCMQMDGFGVVGDSYTGEFYLVNEETLKMITIKLTYQIVETLATYETVGEDYVTLPVSGDDMFVDYDLSKAATALGLESVSALFEGYYAKGMLASGSYSESVDIIGNGLTYNFSGAYEDYADIYINISEDHTQFVTYSNVEPTAPFKAEATMCFEIGTQRYIIHLTLLDSASYQEYVDGINGITVDTDKQGKLYNLQGIEVQAPVKGHLYIQNGKKFIAR